jgi:nicotinamidase-related amidase
MNSALIILDMVNLFDFEGGKALATHARKIAPRIAALRQAYTECGLPVIFVNDNFLDWNREFSELVAICGQSRCLWSRTLSPVEFWPRPSRLCASWVSLEPPYRSQSNPKVSCPDACL